MTAKDAYDKLRTHMKEYWLLASTAELLEWDQETYMPKGGADNRADQMGLLARLTHEMFTDPNVGEWIATCEASDLVKDPESKEAANIRELRRMYDRRTRLPKEFVEESAKLTSKAQHIWADARKASDFKLFEPWLVKILDMNRKKADYYGYETEVYDALMDDYEPGAKAAEVEKVFSGLRKELVELNKRIANAPRRPDISILKRPYDVKKQRIFAELVVNAIGFDFRDGRLDETVHPFCTSIGPGDTRILTRYYPEDLGEGLTGAMHEAGHGLYELGADPKELGMPCGFADSLGMHESQSRMWENQVGRSRATWVYFFPQAQRIFRESLEGVSLEQFYHAMNYSAPSYIRVEADEATYNLHIMLRFELERAMLRGDVQVADVPGEWNKRFKDYLGIEVDKDSNGCLQDIHWSMGAMGYFPTYTLGNLYAAQFYAKVREEISDLDKHFEKGDFTPLLKWLRENIHIHGARWRAADLCKRVTGKPLSHRPLIDYMNNKYAEIYGI
ncbi:MAG: carboxypeptidase M32 [Candidatus Zixiibacteriota bacterium]|nr:MAG: carboxypeptidase M32 [candidate division Zixibacteria bacterium]